MIKRMILMLVAVGVVLGGMIGFKLMMAAGAKKYLAAQAAPPQVVSTIKAEALEWTQELNAVGSLRAINGANLSSEVAGIIETISFDSGAEVEEGVVLIQLRNKDELAQLQALEATARLAQITLDRDLKQLKVFAVSRATVDADRAALNNAKAQVEAKRASIDKKTIRAPFKGRLGIREVDVGQYLTAGAPIVSLQQLEAMYIDFNVPERFLTKLSVGQKVGARADALSDTSFEGEISAINTEVDEATRNIQVRALFKNPDYKLLPGMFAHVSVVTGTPEKQITLPQTAITYNPYGNTVYLVARDEKGALFAKQAFVTLGPTRGDQVAVLSGVNEGDEIVTAGQLKIRNGSPLIINNEIQPKNDPNPKAEDK